MERALSGYPAPPGGVVPPTAAPTRRFAGSMRWDVISELVRAHGWTDGVEVGTADGRCAERVLKACPRLSLTTLDPWEPQPWNDGPENWADWPHEEYEKLARQRLAQFARRAKVIIDYSDKVAATFEDASVDFVFLDGDHSEDGVRADIAAWVPKIRPGGMLLGHDINWPGVRAAVDDLMPGYWIGPNDTWGRAV